VLDCQLSQNDKRLSGFPRCQLRAVLKIVSGENSSPPQRHSPSPKFEKSAYAVAGAATKSIFWGKLLAFFAATKDKSSKTFTALLRIVTSFANFAFARASDVR
jgi:hypothetical protein